MPQFNIKDIPTVENYRDITDILIDKLSLNQRYINFEIENDLIFLIGEPSDEIRNSDYLKYIHNYEKDESFIEQKLSNNLIDSILELKSKEIIKTYHEVGNGGIFKTLLEASFKNNLGFDIETNPFHRKDVFLFSETLGRYIVSINPNNASSLMKYFSDNDESVIYLGLVTDNKLVVDDEFLGTTEQVKTKKNIA